MHTQSTRALGVHRVSGPQPTGHSICVVIVQSLSDPTNALQPCPAFDGRSPVSCPPTPWPLRVCLAPCRPGCRAVAVEPYSASGPPIKPSHRRLPVHDTADTPCACHHPASPTASDPSPGSTPSPSLLSGRRLLPPPFSLPNLTASTRPLPPLFFIIRLPPCPIPHPLAYTHKQPLTPHTHTPSTTHTRIFATSASLRISPSPSSSLVFSESPLPLLSLVVITQ